MVNLEKFLLAIAFTGFVTAHTGFWGEINTSAIAASYNSDANNSALISSELATNLTSKLTTELATNLTSKLATNAPLAIDKQNSVSTLPPSIVTAIQNDIRQRTGLDPSNYTITRATPRTWSDGCLGLGGPAEGCLAAMTPGWRVVVTSNNGRSTWVYRTNQNGSSVRLASPR
jgi:hypothetical protein